MKKLPIAAILFILLLACKAPASAQPSSVSLVSATSDGTAGVNGQVFSVATNDDGTVIAFSTNRAINSLDTNNVNDVYVVDTKAGTTTMISVDASGLPGNGNSGGTEFGLTLSGDGRYVAFDSQASNLVSGDTNDKRDVFVYDMATKTTERVSLSSAGAEAPNGGSTSQISRNGLRVLFASSDKLADGDSNSSSDFYIRDRNSGTTVLASPSTVTSDHPSMSADGLFVSFKTETKLIDTDTNGRGDIYRYDLTSKQTVIVSAKDQIPGNNVSSFSALSGDGRYVVFTSYASNLVDGDSNDKGDVFIKDMNTGIIEVVSVTPSGVSGNDNSGNSFPAVSSDGRFVAFDSLATNLVDGITTSNIQVFLRDRTLQKTYLLSAKPGGEAPNGLAYMTPNSLSADGQIAVFLSEATNIDAKDINDFRDGYIARFGAASGGTLTPKTKLDAPTAEIGKKDATITLLAFDSAEKGSKTYKVRYEVTLVNTKTKVKTIKTTKKTSISFKKLAKGKYSVTYRAQAVSGNSVKFESRASKALKFTITGK